MMVVFTVIFGRFIKVSSEGIPYPIFSYSAILFWTFFATSLSTGSNSVVMQANLVRKIYFPREVIPMASVIAAFVDFCIASFVFLGLMIFYKVKISISLLFLFPMILLQIMFTFGVVFFFSSINVYYRDIRHGVPFLVRIWMYACPIVYSLSVVPEKYRVAYVTINPMAAFIDGYRTVILHAKSPVFSHLALAGSMSVAIFILAYLLFKRMERSFADVI
jgi:lipopolysaccharide transport system permease protein